MSGKAILGWLVFALPEKTGRLAQAMNTQWLGALALVGAVGLGAGATSWYYQQVKPEDLGELDRKVELLLERQETVVSDVQELRRSVCRMRGTRPSVCERRVREDREKYEFELEAETAQDAVDLLTRSRP